MNKVFTIDGTDFSEYLAPYGYSTEQQPVYGSSVTTLDGVEHVSITRWKSYLTVTTLPLNRVDARTLYEAITGAEISVRYYNYLLGEVTQSMRCESVPYELALSMHGTDYSKCIELKFIQN